MCYNSVRRHEHCRSSPQLRCEFLTGLATRAYFVVINKGARQVYLSSSTQWVTKPIMTFFELEATNSGKQAIEDALQYIKMYVAGVSSKTAQRYLKNVEEQVIRLQSKVWSNT